MSSKRITTLLLVVVLCGVVASGALANPKIIPFKAVPFQTQYVPNRFIVVLTEAAGTFDATNYRGLGKSGINSLDLLAASYNVEYIIPQFVGAAERGITALSRYYKVEFTGPHDLQAVMEAYAADPKVDHVEPIGIHPLYATPNDFYYDPYQWYHNQTSDRDIDSPEAWDIQTGDANLIIALLDSGVRYYHPDLGGVNASPSNPGASRGNMWINTAELNGSAGVDDDGNGYTDDWIGYDFIDGVSFCWPGEDCNTKDNDPRDFNGHGTHTAGIIGMLTNDGYGMAGTAGGWGNGSQAVTGNGVKVMALRMGYSYNYLGQEYGVVMMDAAAEAFYYATDNGAVIASCSWGSSNSGGLGAAVNNFISNGGLVVVAAGNDGAETAADYLNGRGDCISVAATNESDNGASFTTYGTWVDISAPGNNIYSTYHDHTDPNTNYWASLGGTSMATPMTAAVCGLIWSQNPGWSAAQVENQLYTSADDIDAYLSSKYIGKMGAGRINSYNAVNTGPPPPPVAEFSGSPTSGTEPLTVNFADLSTGSITSWSWTFGDGGTSTAADPSYQYLSTGTYTVSLTVTGPGGSDGTTKNGYITVTPCTSPVADFSGSPTTGTAPLTVNFTDLSTGATFWSWDFGDGSSSAQNPNYGYTAAGDYTVSLTVTNGCGSDGATKVDYIHVDPPATQQAFALADIPVKGTISGAYTNTHTSDNSYELLTEAESGGKPSRRYSTLEHKWNFNVTAGATVAFYVEAYRPDNAEGDDFTFEYSTDDASYSPLVTVNSATEQTYSAGMPSSVSGTVYIRVVDTDHTQGARTFDDLYVDYMYIESGGTPPPPDTIFVYAINVTRVGGKGNRYQGQTVVTVHNLAGQPVAGAVVNGQFSGPSSDSKSGTTDGDGQTTILSQKIKNPSGTWCFQVNNVSLGTNVYDPSLNVESSDCEGGAAATLAVRPESEFELSGNYPNPFNATTTIFFSLSEPAQVSLEVYNVTGRRVATLVNGWRNAGKHSTPWDATGMASGIYFSRLQIGAKVQTGKLILMK